MVLSNPFPIPGFPIYSSYIALFQKYKYYKLNAASTIPQPNNALAAGEELANCSMPPVDVTFNSSFREGGQWTLPSEANRTAQYINPYSAVALPAGAPGGWLQAGFLNLINAQPSIAKWLFGGPSPGKYPKEVWPENNIGVAHDSCSVHPEHDSESCPMKRSRVRCHILSMPLLRRVMALSLQP